MPIYIYTLESSAVLFCGLKVWTFKGYGRALAWRARIMRISQKASLTFRTPLGAMNLMVLKHTPRGR